MAANREQRVFKRRRDAIECKSYRLNFAVLPLRLRLVRDGRHFLSAIVGHTADSWEYDSGMAMMREQNSTL